MALADGIPRLMVTQDPFANDEMSDHEILREIHREVKRTNGRVSLLEDWRRGVETQEAIRAAVVAAKGEALITRAQWRTVTLVISSVGAAAGLFSAVASFLVEKVL